jgi:2-polyprenyl-3-methyl-5-hydroxy-6-metoxy-1,4-benzoquinol methylase
MNIVKAGSALLRLDTVRISNALKERWRDRTFPGGMLHRGEQARFERLYLIPDPWSLNCQRERYRFSETNRVIRENFGRAHSLLEIGCGEGLHSSELQQLCNKLYGIDVSRRAVRRAERRCPGAIFAAADIYVLPQPPLLTRFDVVTACEVLYYYHISDVPAVLRRISELGRSCLISYCDSARDGLDPHVRGIPGVQSETVSYQGVSWTLAWWRS